MIVTALTTDPEMMMIRSRILQVCHVTAFIIILATLPVVASAQQNDFQFWTSAQAGLKVGNNVSVHIEEEIRLKENSTQIDRQINNLGISMKLNKYFRTALFYRIVADWKNPDTYQWRQGFYADLLCRYSPGRFILGYRARFQSARIEFYENQAKFLSKVMNRHKFSLAYNIKDVPLTPFAEGELFFQIYNQHNSMTDLRIWLGLDYSPGKMHEFSLKYGFDREFMTTDPLTSYIIALNYTINLKL